MIENVSRSAPALLPLFRSDQQLRLVAELFGDGPEELSIGELAQRAGVAKATASREVARLARHGLVVVRAIGRNTLVRANWDLPWAAELRSILVQTVGVLGQLADALRDVGGVEAAFVFGSWAARYLGEPGPAPRDIDVLVVGDASMRAVRQACRSVEDALRVSVNPVVLTAEAWNSRKAEPFVAEVRQRPLVAVNLARR
jgi:DNA-binding transcriptional ArsR family regulator